MTRKCILIFCDNEHGSGDVCFPNVDAMSNHEIKQMFLHDNSAAQLRQLAKKEGWGRVNGADYCPGCMESGL